MGFRDCPTSKREQTMTRIPVASLAVTAFLVVSSQARAEEVECQLIIGPTNQRMIACVGSSLPGGAAMVGISRAGYDAIRESFGNRNRGTCDYDPNRTGSELDCS